MDDIKFLPPSQTLWDSVGILANSFVFWLRICIYLLSNIRTLGKAKSSLKTIVERICMCFILRDGRVVKVGGGPILDLFILGNDLLFKGIELLFHLPLCMPFSRGMWPKDSIHTVKCHKIKGVKKKMQEMYCISLHEMCST